MKKSLVLAFFISIITFSCKDNYSDCGNCEGFEPQYGQLNIALTINSENSKVPVEIYKGNPESSTLYITATLSSVSNSIPVEINHYYTVKACYKSGAKTIVTVDGDDVKSIACDSACWSVQNGNIDATLKYD